METFESKLDINVVNRTSTFLPVVTVTEFDDGSRHVGIDWMDAHRKTVALLCNGDLSYESEIELDSTQLGDHLDRLVEAITITIKQEGE